MLQKHVKWLKYENLCKLFAVIYVNESDKKTTSNVEAEKYHCAVFTGKKTKN